MSARATEGSRRCSSSFARSWWVNGLARRTLPVDVEPELAMLASSIPSNRGRLGRYWLDVGSGEGRALQLADGTLDRVVCVDESLVALARLRQLTSTDQFLSICADGGRLPLPNDSCYLVTMLDVLSVAAEPERLICEASRVLAREGHLLLNAQSMTDSTRSEYLLKGAVKDGGGEVRSNGNFEVTYYTEKRLLSLIVNQGFRVERIIPYTLAHDGHNFNTGPHVHHYYAVLAVCSPPDLGLYQQ